MEEGVVSLAETIHSVATGPKRRRERLTPLGFLVFGGTLAVVIVGGLYTDRWLDLPPLLPGIAGTVAGVLFLMAGGWLCGWCVVRFLRSRGTPVPLNPPDEPLRARASTPFHWAGLDLDAGVRAGAHGGAEVG
jgi:hypothetical protein